MVVHFWGRNSVEITDNECPTHGKVPYSWQMVHDPPKGIEPKGIGVSVFDAWLVKHLTYGQGSQLF